MSNPDDLSRDPPDERMSRSGNLPGPPESAPSSWTIQKALALAKELQGRAVDLQTPHLLILSSADLALGLSTSSPENSGGPFIAFTMEGDLGIGGGVVVSFGLPDFEFGGFTIPVSAGEEFNLSVGGGYTFVFN